MKHFLTDGSDAGRVKKGLLPEILPEDSFKCDICNVLSKYKAMRNLDYTIYMEISGFLNSFSVRSQAIEERYAGSLLHYLHGILKEHLNISVIFSGCV